MAVLLFAGPADPAKAQTMLEELVSEKISRLAAESCASLSSANIDEELRWIADQDLANLYLLLISWVKLLQENQMAWWCEMSMTPTVGWILGILQAIPASGEGIAPRTRTSAVAFIASGMAEHVILASMLNSPGLFVDPKRYVAIRSNCQWTKEGDPSPNDCWLASLESKIACNFFRYDGMRRLEQLEHATNVKHRTRHLQRDEIQQTVVEYRSSDCRERQQQLLIISWLQREWGLPGPPDMADEDIFEAMFRDRSVVVYLEALALAEMTVQTGALASDPYLFFLDRSVGKSVTYRSAAGKHLSGKRWRAIDKMSLIDQGFSPEQLQWMSSVQRLFSPQYLRGIGEIILRTDYYRRYHPQEWRRIMEGKGVERVEEELVTAMELVESGSMSQLEYRQKVEGGELADYRKLGWSMGDRKFQQLYPLHPLAESNRMCRIAAADRIRDMAAQRTTAFPEAALDKIHSLLFDCCGSVRHSLATALFHAGNHTSVEFLKKLARLAREETDSALVRETAEVAALRCDQRESGCKSVGDDESALALVTGDVQLAIQLHRLAKECRCRLIFPEPGTPDLYVFPAVLRIVNRRILGAQAWNWYLDYLAELARPLSADAIRELADEGIICQDFEADEPPLILTDGFFREEDDTWGTLPEQGLTVYRAEEWMADWIMDKAREIVEKSCPQAGFKGDGAEVPKD